MKIPNQLYYTYVLFSQKDQNFYVGSTTNLIQRLNQHYKGQVISTKHRYPLVLSYLEILPDKHRARKRELYFKTSWGKKFLKLQIGQLSRLNSAESAFNGTTLSAKLLNGGARSAEEIKLDYNNGAVSFK